MTIVLGLILGVGVLFAASPFLWKRSTTAHVDAGPLRTLKDRLVQAGLERVSVLTFASVSVILALAGGALVLAITNVVAAGVVAGLAGLALPTFLVIARARRRRRTARIVWPDVVDHLISGVRSGLALPDSVVTLAHTGPVETRAAFAAFEGDYRTTGNFSLCLDRLKARLADPVADRILETLRMSREVGGSELTHVLRNLGIYLRQDAAVRAEIEARQSWVVIAARLGIAAPWIVLLLLSTRPEAAQAYNSVAGGVLIAGSLVVSIVAYRIMIALGRLPEERRWFE